MDQRGNEKTEHRNVDSERHTVDVNHVIVALHGAKWSFQHGTAGVLIFTAGLDVRLNADDTFTLYFGFTAMAVGITQ